MSLCKCIVGHMGVQMGMWVQVGVCVQMDCMSCAMHESGCVCVTVSICVTSSSFNSNDAKH